jgi:hypothetical protein
VTGAWPAAGCCRKSAAVEASTKSTPFRPRCCDAKFDPHGSPGHRIADPQRSPWLVYLANASRGNFAIPKSSTFTTWLSVTSMLAGLTSRWTMPAACAAPRAEAACAPRWRTCSKARPSGGINSLSERPATYSITRKSAIVAGDIAESNNIRMVQRRHSAGFLKEAKPVSQVGRQFARKQFDGNGPSEPCVHRPVHFPHAARSDDSFNLIWTKYGPGCNCLKPDQAFSTHPRRTIERGTILSHDRLQARPHLGFGSIQRRAPSAVGRSRTASYNSSNCRH